MLLRLLYKKSLDARTHTSIDWSQKTPPHTHRDASCKENNETKQKTVEQ